jgi:hypothetical protein
VGTGSSVTSYRLNTLPVIFNFYIQYILCNNNHAISFISSMNSGRRLDRQILFDRIFWRLLTLRIALERAPPEHSEAHLLLWQQLLAQKLSCVQ